MEPVPTHKCSMAKQLWSDWQIGHLILGNDTSQPAPVFIPGRPTRPKLVPPRQVPRRNLGTSDGRSAFVHAVAHIEFNAINLALDAAYRFRQMPESFVGEWLRVAAEEATHFKLLNERLNSMGKQYGDFPAHNGLWEMACKTNHDPLLRMALVPRVLEARGLDVTPGMIERLSAVGDTETISILDVILRDEVDHVRIGSYWYVTLCRGRGLEPESTFHELWRKYTPGHVRGPFNHEARLAAGFSHAEVAYLEASQRENE